MNPIPELAAAIREAAPDALILVDSVSGLGAVPFEMDAWGVDVVVTGSQKAWMAAPGLAMVAASRARLGRDGDGDDAALLPRPPDATATTAADGQTPFTPAIAVVYQVDEGLRLDARRGPGRRLRPPRGVRGGDAGRPAGARLRALRRPRAIASRTVTAAQLPTGLDWKAFNGDAQARTASSSPAARASSPARSSGSATSAR